MSSRSHIQAFAKPFVLRVLLCLVLVHATFTSYDFLASTTVQNTSSMDNENIEKLIKSKRNSSTERNHKVESEYESEFVTFSAGGGNFGGYRRLLDLLDVKSSALVRTNSATKSVFSGCHLVLGDTTNYRNRKYSSSKRFNRENHKIYFENKKRT